MFVFFVLSFVSPVPGQSTICSGGILSDPQITTFLNAHNNLRSNVAQGHFQLNDGSTLDPAENMLEMYWDCGLRTSAQDYADTCPTGPSGTSGIGENIYRSFSNQQPSIDQSSTNAINAWINELKQYGVPAPGVYYSTSSNANIAEGAQMIWANTYLVGCGVATCSQSSDPAFQYESVVACQYYPKGDNDGEQIYLQGGRVCYACPDGTICTLNTGVYGLCANSTFTTTTTTGPSTVSEATFRFHPTGYTTTQQPGPPGHPHFPHFPHPGKWRHSRCRF